jgi:hypothetical protein
MEITAIVFRIYRRWQTVQKKAFMKSLLIIFLVIYSVCRLYGQTTINSFTPDSGSVGTLITITGTNLSSPTSVTIGGKATIIVSNTETTLMAMVMPGTISGVISLTTTTGSASSASNFMVTSTSHPSLQQGGKLTGTDAVGDAFGDVNQGFSVSLSADGNTAIVGGIYDSGGFGAAWVYTRIGNTWTQQGSKLVGSGAKVTAFQGYSVSLSADGNTAIVGGPDDNLNVGAAWVFTRSGSTWTQQGSKLVGTGVIGSAGSHQGCSVSLSADGNTAIVGGYADNLGIGAAWVYTCSGNTWTQQGSKLVGTSVNGYAEQGFSVSLSADGNTAIVGGPYDNSNVGAAWVYTRTGSTWIQQGNKMVGTGAIGNAYQGTSVSLSADGNTAILGGSGDNSDIGAAWVFARNGSTWSQQGSKLVGTGASINSLQGRSVSLSADGSTAIMGGPDHNTYSSVGAAWIFTSTATHNTAVTNILAGMPNIFPNPTKGLVTLDIPDGKVTVLDMEGKVLYEKTLGKDKTIDLTKYNSGIYIFILKTKDAVYQYKIIKTRL